MVKKLYHPFEQVNAFILPAQIYIDSLFKPSKMSFLCLAHLKCYTLIEKSRAQISRCYGVALSYQLVVHIELMSLHLFPLGQQEKLLR